METVKAVSRSGSFLAGIRSSPRSLQRSGVSARQTSPRAWVAMKLIASGVANWAASTRSPSFSRSSASQTTTIFPARMSSRASSMVLKGALGHTSFSTYLATTSTSRFTDAPCASDAEVVRSRVSGMSEIEKVSAVYIGNRERHPIHRDGPLGHHVAQQVRGRAQAHHPGVALLGHRLDLRDAVDVALHDVAAQAVRGAQRQLQVDLLRRR